MQMAKYATIDKHNRPVKVISQVGSILTTVDDEGFQRESTCWELIEARAVPYINALLDGLDIDEVVASLCESECNGEEKWCYSVGYWAGSCLGVDTVCDWEHEWKQALRSQQRNNGAWL
jgi:hypothetical protein